MNQKNSLGLNKCFLDLDDPFKLFEKWFDEAKRKEINDPNALALGTASKTGVPSVRMVLLKGFDKNGFIFYKAIRDDKDLDYILSLIKRYNIIKACYQKAQHYINLASNSLSVFNDCEEENILENLTSFSLSRNF